MNVTLLGIDLAKSVFQVCGLDGAGQVVFNRQVRRAGLEALVSQHAGARVVMEACSGSNHWGRRFQQAGHEVRLIPPQHVKPFVKRNKSDRNDALAICEAAARPQMRFVAPRTLAATDGMLLHRQRERLVKQRTQLTNQLRGMANEYGVVFPRSAGALRSGLQTALARAENELTPMARELLGEGLEEWLSLDRRIQRLDKRLQAVARASDAVQRAMSIPGIGVLTGTAACAMLGDGRGFHHGRHFSASLGLVPREDSSGGRQRLGAISKRGNGYLRWLLIQGGHSLLRTAHRHPHDRLCGWALAVAERRGYHKAVVAVANKLARLLWAVVYHGRTYQAQGLAAA